MNARTAKLLSRVATTRSELRELKRLWHLTPHTHRHRARKLLRRLQHGF